jgi:type IV secretory pathway VirB2 component (pilin)
MTTTPAKTSMHNKAYMLGIDALDWIADPVPRLTRAILKSTLNKALGIMALLLCVTVLNCVSFGSGSVTQSAVPAQSPAHSLVQAVQTFIEGPSLASADGGEFDSLYEKVKGWLTGGVGKLLVILLIIGGAICLFAGKYAQGVGALIAAAVIGSASTIADSFISGAK